MFQLVSLACGLSWCISEEILLFSVCPLIEVVTDYTKVSL